MRQGYGCYISNAADHLAVSSSDAAPVALGHLGEVGAKCRDDEMMVFNTGARVDSDDSDGPHRRVLQPDWEGSAVQSIFRERQSKLLRWLANCCRTLFNIECGMSRPSNDLDHALNMPPRVQRDV